MTPWMLEAGDSLKRLLQRAVAGALVMVIVGFAWGGWKLGSTAEKVTKERAGPTVAAPLPPTSVDQSETQHTRSRQQQQPFIPLRW